MASPSIRTSVSVRFISANKQSLVLVFSLTLLAIQGSLALKPAQTNAQSASTAQETKESLSQEARKLDAEIRKLYRADKYDEARRLAERLLELREKTLGPEHPDVLESLGILATLYKAQNEYAKAEPLYQRVLSTLEKKLGPDHIEVARPLNGLASLYSERGDFAKAEPMFLRALAIRERALKPDDPLLASSLHNLVLLYSEKGDYVKAEPRFQRALAIWEKALGPGHPQVADALTNLANLYHKKGDYAQAGSMHQRALAIREKALGSEHPEVASSLNNLAVVYRVKEDYARAEPLYQRALAIWEKALGTAHPQVAYAVNNLAIVYDIKGDYARAEPLYRRALAIWEKALGPEHIQVAIALNNLANFHNKKGDYSEARALYLRTLAIREKFQGAWHQEIAYALNNLAILHNTKGETAQAIAFQSRAVAISERNTALNIATGSERQKLAYLATLMIESNHSVSLHIRSAPNEPAARDLAVTTILQRKGRALDALTDNIVALRHRANPQDQALLDQYKDAVAKLARLALGGPQGATPAAAQQQIKALEEQKEKLEAEIGSRSAEFRVQSQPVTLESVRAAIPAGAALVEFAVYLPFNPKHTKTDEAFGKPHYVAYVLRRQGETQWVERGEASRIDRAIGNWRRALRDPQKEKDAKDLARIVDEQVMRPIRKLLGGTRQLLISPDGDLNLIPFVALLDENNRHLVENYSISYLTGGRDLLWLQVARRSKSNPLVIADPVYGEKTAARTEGSGAEDPLAKVYFSPLLTGAEADAIKSVMPDSVVLKRNDATEAGLKQSRAPRVLHIATHGFFLQNLDPSPTNSRSFSQVGLPATRSGDVSGGAIGRVENPLLQSGLALAGANRRSGGDDDGILTALEAAGLDLWGTKLVVLSACDTGVGEVRNGEGVYGLRRALVLAGAESQVVSLWKVNDVATKDLMVAYYKELMKGAGRAEALRRVQLKMLRDPKRRHPYFWASFIHSGEWASLDGRR